MDYSKGTIKKCECGSDRFYMQSQIFELEEGSHSGTNLWFECCKCGKMHNKYGYPIDSEGKQINKPEGE